MKRKRHTEEQIIAILKEHEAGVKTADLCRKHGISEGASTTGKPSTAVSRSPKPSG
jgi:putative transposase